MSERVVAIATFAAALGSGISGGVLFAFSTFIIAALARLPPPQGIAAMQAINLTVINPAFMLTFLGTGVICLGLVLVCLLGRGGNGSLFLILGGLAYLIGCIGVTMAFNVPLNDALSGFQQTTPDAVDFWTRYVRDWTIWNHVRTAAAISAAALLILAIRQTSR